MAVVGVISDTHGLLRSGAIEFLQGSDLIVHAGDIGSMDILDTLRLIAPLTVVRGNMDREPWASGIRDDEVIELNGKYVYVLHDLKELNLDASAAGFDVVISGHTHKPDTNKMNGVLYLNPGSAGPRRFNLPISIAKLHLNAASIAAEIHILDNPNPQ
jgi:putative phosphoesterase